MTCAKPSSGFRVKWSLLLCAGVVLGLALGSRHVQGLFMLPMLSDRGWGRESFAFAAGLQTSSGASCNR